MDVIDMYPQQVAPVVMRNTRRSKRQMYVVGRHVSAQGTPSTCQVDHPNDGTAEEHNKMKRDTNWNMFVLHWVMPRVD